MLFYKGDGYADIIDNYDTGAGRNRSYYALKASIKAMYGSIVYQVNTIIDLQLTIKSTGERHQYKLAFSKAVAYEIQQVIFADGSSWDTAELKRRAIKTVSQDTLTGTDSDDTLRGGAGDNTLNGGKGKDTLKGW